MLSPIAEHKVKSTASECNITICERGKGYARQGTSRCTRGSRRRLSSRDFVPGGQRDASVTRELLSEQGKCFRNPNCAANMWVQLCFVCCTYAKVLQEFEIKNDDWRIPSSFWKERKLRQCSREDPNSHMQCITDSRFENFWTEDKKSEFTRRSEKTSDFGTPFAFRCRSTKKHHNLESNISWSNMGTYFTQKANSFGIKRIAQMGVLTVLPIGWLVQGSPTCVNVTRNQSLGKQHFFFAWVTWHEFWTGEKNSSWQILLSTITWYWFAHSDVLSIQMVKKAAVSHCWNTTNDSMKKCSDS